MARPVTNNTLTFKEAVNIYSKDYISNLYNKKAVTATQLAKDLNVGRTVLYKLFSYYNLEGLSYWDKATDLLLEHIDCEALIADLPIIGCMKALEKYNISRKQFYNICNQLNIDYKTLVKPLKGKTRHENSNAVHERCLSDISLEKVRETYLLYGFCGTIQELNIKRSTLEYYLKTYGKDIRGLKDKSSNNSYYNNLFAKYLVEKNIQFEREFSINKKRYDFKIGNLLIEINPNRTHSLDGRDTMYKAVPFLYHQNKSLLALENNFLIVHLYQNNDMLEFIEKYLEQSFKITSKLHGNALHINLDGFCTFDALQAELEKFSNIPNKVVIMESLDFCTLNLNRYAVGKALPPQVFYIKDETIISESDFIEDEKAHCLSDAGKLVWTFGGDQLNEICSD
jgi:hypothetical protein